jgi:hypothetical protein
MQLRFTHDPRESKQQPVMINSRLVQSLAIGNEHSKNRTQLQQLMPVTVVARQPGGVQTQDQPRLTEPDLADQALKSLAFGTGCTRFAQVIVNDRNPLAWPAEPYRPIHQVVLQLGALVMLADLTRRGLTDVNVCELRFVCRRDALSALGARAQHDLGSRCECAAVSLRSAERADLRLPVAVLRADAEAIEGWVGNLRFGESAPEDDLFSSNGSTKLRLSRQH